MSDIGLKASRLRDLEVTDWTSLVKGTDMLRDYLDSYRGSFRSVFGSARLSKDEPLDSLVNAVFYRNLADLNRKARSKPYYLANSRAFYILTSGIVDTIAEHQAQGSQPSDLLARNCWGLLKPWVMDSIGVMCDYYKKVAKTESPFSMTVYQTGLEPDLALYHSCLQLIFGQESFRSYGSPSLYLGAAPIRVMIELRLKRSMGVFGLSDEAGNVLPLTMADFLKVYKRFVARKEITLAVPIQAVERVHMWANIFIHSGITFYSWYPALAVEFLRPLMLGRWFPDGSYDSSGGVMAPTSVVDSFRAELESCLRSTGRYRGKTVRLIRLTAPACVDPENHAG